eukprot:252693-Prymnesium_polylepis.1
MPREPTANTLSGREKSSLLVSWSGTPKQSQQKSSAAHSPFALYARAIRKATPRASAQRTASLESAQTRDQPAPLRAGDAGGKNHCDSVGTGVAVDGVNTRRGAALRTTRLMFLALGNLGGESDVQRALTTGVTAGSVVFFRLGGLAVLFRDVRLYYR